MTRPPKNMSAATQHALSVIAHAAMASRIDKEIKGMAGFTDFYRKQMAPKDQVILLHFDRLCRRATADLAKMLGDEGASAVTTERKS